MEETRKPARRPRAAAPKPAAKKAVTPKAVTPKAVARKPAGAQSRVAVAAQTAAEREEKIRTAAYYRAERRGFAPGYEWEDWLAAEAEVTALAGPEPARKPRKAAARKPTRTS